MARLSICLLGCFHVTQGTTPVFEFESNKVRALLAYLAVEAHRPHSRDHLAGLLWPDQPDADARHNLRQALSNLRQAIGDRDAQSPLLLVTRHTVQLNPEGDAWLDVAVFDALLATCENHAHTSPASCEPCLERLGQAVALYQGDFLAGFHVEGSQPFDEWAVIQREHSHLRALHALHTLTAHYERRRDYERAERYARRQVELEPWREEAHQQLIRLLACRGERSAALAQYQVCRRVLADELGIEPHPETSALYQRIRASGAVHSHNLPIQPTPFVGREEELAVVAERLADPLCRLLTLVGPGGSGKTRLALQAAAEALPGFLHGVWLVSLASVGTARLLAPAIASALGLRFQGSKEPAAELADYIREKELLLVLDGCEHLLPGAALIDDLLQAAPALKIIVTSRERLGLRAEWLLPVQGLPYTPTGADGGVDGLGAVQLFVHGARRVSTTFSLGEDNRADVTRICALLDGLPLGIELASACVRLLSCQQIAAEIERDLDFLTSTLRDVTERHHSLRAVFDHSWRLLDGEARLDIARLAVFRGPFSSQAAEAVALAAPATLLALADKSLLTQARPGRYDLHALVKQYAAEKLAAMPAEQQQTVERHGRYWLRFLNERQQALTGRGQAEALAEIGASLADIGAAWAGAIAAQEWPAVDAGLDGLYLFYRIQARYREGEELLALAATTLAAATAGAGPPQPLLARLRTRLAELRGLLGDCEGALSLLEQSRAALEDVPGPESGQELALALEVLGSILYWAGDYAAARQPLEASVALYRRVGGAWGLTQALNNLANVICSAELDFDIARLYRESLALSRQIGDQAGIGRALTNLGGIEQGRYNYGEARRLYEEGAAVSQAIGDNRTLAIALSNLGQVAIFRGEYERAAALLEQSLDLKRQMGNRHSMIHTLRHLGRLACEVQRLNEADGHFRAALALARDVRSDMLIAYLLVSVARLRAARGEREQAVELLHTALQHVGDDQEVRYECNQLLEQLAGELDGPVLTACAERGRLAALESVVARIVTGR